MPRARKLPPAPTRMLTDVALAFTADRGWHYAPVPPDWWFDLQDDLLEQDAPLIPSNRGPVRALSLVPDLPAASVQATACRPGTGPCRRRHEHASIRRVAS
jgi:hypothetical protein